MRYEIGRSRLRQVMREKGVSQTELAAKVRRSDTQISKWVNRERVMTLLSAYEVAKALGCNIEDLYEFRRRGS